MLQGPNTAPMSLWGNCTHQRHMYCWCMLLVPVLTADLGIAGCANSDHAVHHQQCSACPSVQYSSITA